MKKNIILFVAVLFLGVYSASAQWTDNGSTCTTPDNVGIGFSSPTNILHVAKNMTGPQIIIQNLGGGGGAGFTMIDDKNAADWKFKSMFGGGFKIRDNSNALDVIQIEGNSLANAIYIKAGGNIGIGGITNPQSTLAVNGKITAKEIEVTLDGWADYVFEEDYHLSPLSEVESYINKNKHLPGIPSAKEVAENGVELGQMNKLLMLKVEELTLYVIQLQKEVDSLKDNQ